MILIHLPEQEGENLGEKRLTPVHLETTAKMEIKT